MDVPFKTITVPCFPVELRFLSGNSESELPDFSTKQHVLGGYCFNFRNLWRYRKGKKFIFFPNKGILLSRLQLRYVLLTESPIVFTLIQIVGYTCVKSILFAHLFGLLLCIIWFLQQVLSSFFFGRKKKSLDLVFRFSILGKPCSSCYNEWTKLKAIIFNPWKQKEHVLCFSKTLFKSQKLY